jgi:peptidoglycan/xylan/chitin deacetylase (PgdA/CDA1 family)
VDLFAAYHIPITCFVPGWVIENDPAAAAYILGHGNEIGHHGYLHEWPNRQSASEERRALEQGLRAIEKLTGSQPRGYRAPYYGLSRHSFDLLIEYGFLYESSLFADDVPILLDNGKGRLIELPIPATTDDYNQYVNNPAFECIMKVSAPAQALDVFKADFEAMWELGGLWSSVWHPGVSGRPAQALAIRDLIEHMQAKGEVWFATHQQVAEHVTGLMAKGVWQPRVETVPFYREPVLR